MKSTENNIPVTTGKLFGLFLALTFALTWGIAALALIFPRHITALFGEFGYKNPLYILAVYAPAFSALFLVMRYYGLKGVRGFLRRLTLFKMPLKFWFFIIFGIPVIYYSAAFIEGTLTGDFPYSPWYNIIPALFFMLILGPVEEFGWRGVALPLLQRRLPPLFSGLIIGVIWGIWHLPSFFIGGTPHYDWGFLSFFIGVISLSLIMTCLFNESKGSIIIAALFHFQINNPVWPDAHLWSSILFTLAALIILIVKRKEMLSMDAGVTELFLT